MSFRRLLPLLLLNVAVSLVVALSVIYVYERRTASRAVPVATALVAAATPGALDDGGVPPAVAEAGADSAESTPIPTPLPDGPITHIVKQGESIGALSLTYDVPMADIMAANGLTDPNLISVGQALIIPLGGADAEPTVPAATPTSEPTATPEPIVLSLAVTGAGTPADERVVVTNDGAGAIDLSGWTLQDGSGLTYTFGQVTIFGNGVQIEVHTGAGTNDATALYWGRTEAAWSSGATVTLSDTTGAVQATTTVP